MKLLTVVGARPQFIKSAALSHSLADHPGITELLIHTGQHFDAGMSDVFFDELGIRTPDVRLDVHGGTHGDMTGRMLQALEPLIMDAAPDRVVVFGDTNSTLAAALAAAKLQVPVAHVEAGLRSFDRGMPEEINRIVTDHLSDRLYCPTETAVRNLEDEGIGRFGDSVSLVGDVMYDATLLFASKARPPAALPEREPFVLATVHRAENTDDRDRLASIMRALDRIHTEIAHVVFPVHPRTRDALRRGGIPSAVQTIAPVGYLEMLWLLSRSTFVVTDSGGLQKEAYFFRRPCATVRDRTEWVELVTSGANVLVDADADRIIAAARRGVGTELTTDDGLYGGGLASRRIAAHLAH